MSKRPGHVKKRKRLHLDTDEQIVLTIMHLQLTLQVLYTTGSPTEAMPALEDSLHAIDTLATMLCKKLEAQTSTTATIHKDAKANIIEFQKSVSSRKS